MMETGTIAGEKEAGLLAVPKPAKPEALNMSEAVAHVVNQIDDLIQQGVLVPGQILVEAQLSKRLNVGRVPVREALRILAGDGVVQLAKGQSARVREIGPKRLLDMMEFIRSFSALSMRMFAERGVCDDSVRALGECIAEIDRASDSGNVSRIFAGMTHFGEILIQYSGNDYMAEIWARVHVKHYNRYLMGMANIHSLAKTANSYREILKALVDGNAEDAIRIEGRLWDYFLPQLQQMIDESADRSLASSNFGAI